MQDKMLEEIWRVREELVKRHGGVHGYLQYLQTLDRERIRKAKQNRLRKVKPRAAKNGQPTRRRTAKV